MVHQMNRRILVQSGFIASLMHHVLSDLGSLILIILNEHTLSFGAFPS